MGAYEDTVGWLAALEVTAGWDLGLERMRAALALRGHPEARWPALHVAGTNGKGSTAALLDAVLTAAGRVSGLYTSPHLVDFTERIRVCGRTIPREAVVALVAELRAELAAAAIALTHFEFVTLLACEWFTRVGVEVAVVEVGLGGRLDATNAVLPIVTAVTTIARDHEAWLGHDLAAIAAEKAGIFKPGVPAVMGRLVPEAAGVVAARAAEVGAPLVRAGVDAVLAPTADGLAFRAPGVAWDGLRLALPGAFQRDNAEVALAALALVQDRFPCSADAVRRGLATVRWPGRLAVVREAPRVVLDGAHNPAGVAALARELPALVRGHRPLVLVLAVMADKDWRAMLEPLLPGVDRVVVTRVGRRGADPTELARALAGRLSVEAVDDPRAALRAAVARAAPAGMVLVTGSLFLVGEAYAELEGERALFEPWQPGDSDGTQAAP